MFNHWATGLRSGLLPQDCEVATQKLPQKRSHFERSFHEGFFVWSQGMIVCKVCVGSPKSSACFVQGLAPSMVRWEVSCKGKSFQKTRWNIDLDQHS